MDYFKRNKEKAILAAATLIISLVIYLMTMAPTVSFWDCGEFIATSYTLGVPHPPGSPFYLLLGRFFSMLPTSSDIAYRVNLMSPTVSALSVMFLSLIIVQLLKVWGDPKTTLHKIAVYGGAFIGAMTFAFTDSHWFNAVEAEVYSFSTFLTAIVVWLILAWEEKSDKLGHERYLLIIAYIIGLAIGIHILNLLALFFIALIVYFKRTKVSSIPWLVADLIIGVTIAGLIFLIARQFKLSFGYQAFFTLAVFLLIYVPLYRRSKVPRVREHSKNVLMAFVTSFIFLIINGGVIRGIPQIADKMGIAWVAITVVLVFGITAFMIHTKYKIASLGLMALVLILVGYSSYITIFIRSNQDPGIDENDPETTKRAVAYLEREQYGRRSFTDIFDRSDWKPKNKYSSKTDFFWNYQIKKMYIRYFNWQFIGRHKANVDPFQFILPFPFLIGVYGMLIHFNRDRHKALAVLALFLFTGLMIILYLNQPDPQPRERDYSYVGSFFAFSIWIGIGVTEIISYFMNLKKEKLQKPLTYLIAALLLIVLPVNILASNYKEHSRKGNYVAWDYSYNILQTCEPDGIIFTNGDNDTFPLWYLQEVERVRKDVRVVNLSLLNTPWYIKQLRDNEPKVSLGGMTDDAIDKLSIIPWKEKEVRISPPPNSDMPPIEWTLKPTIMGQGLRVQDLMIWKLLESNRWRRPMYFAVTVSPENKLGMDKYLQMDGLAFRIHPKKVSRINKEKLTHNLFKVYKYRNLNNPDVYFNDNIIKLIGNYRSGFLQMAVNQLYRSRNEPLTMKGEDMELADEITGLLPGKEGVLQILDSMSVRLPEEIVPIRNREIYFQLGAIYHEAGRSEELQRRLDNLLSRENLTTRERVKYAGAYSQQLRDNEKALEILEELFSKSVMNPDPEVIGLLVSIYERTGQYTEASSVLDSWLRIHPNDGRASAMRNEFRAKIPARMEIDSTNIEQSIFE